ncbi:MAG: hypothetical protein RR314_06490 [Oscillospiraceae bacterium]
MTISKRDAKLLLILLGIILLLVAYLAIYNPYIAKTEAVDAEIAALAPELSELQGHYANLDAYKSGIDTAAELMDSELRNYPSAIRDEDLIMYATTLQDKTGLRLTGVAFTGAEAILQFQEVSVAENGAVALRDVTAWRSGATATMTLGYQELKDMIDYISKTRTRTSLESVTVTFDSETGELTGDLTFNKYFISGAGDVYSPTEVPSVPLGKDNLFGTLTPAAEAGDATIIG